MNYASYEAILSVKGTAPDGANMVLGYFLLQTDSPLRGMYNIKNKKRCGYTVGFGEGRRNEANAE